MVTNLVFLKNYNNYFNRIIKSYNTLDEYTSNFDSKTFLDRNFNPADGVYTSTVINWSIDDGVQYWFPDYMLVTDSDGNIISRWFVTESDRTREGQYEIQLKRDTVTDFKENILEAPTFIEKATLSSNDPLLYNPEGMSYNQIKKDEILLKDKTNMAWIVGYCVQDSVRHPESNYWTGSSEIRTMINSASIPTWIKNAFGTNKKFAISNDSEMPLSIKMQVRSYESLVFGIYAYGLMQFDNIYDDSSYIGAQGQTSTFSGWGTNLYLNMSSMSFLDLFNPEKFVAQLNQEIISYSYSMADSFQKLESAYRINLMSGLRTDLGIDNYTRYVNLKEYNGLIYKDENKYYKIHVDTVQNSHSTKIYPFNSSASALNYYRTAMRINSDPSYTKGTYTLNEDTNSGDNCVELGTDYTEVYIWREEVYSGYIETQSEVFEQADIRVYLPQTRQHVLQQPYDMFCIPYGELACSDWVTNKDVGLLAARTLAKAGVGTTSYIYDVQLLPYCPVQDLYVAGKISENLLTRDVDYTYITDQYNNNLSIIFWCRNTDFTFNIYKFLEINSVGDNYAESLKISSECDVYRLCSPNYDGIFEFNLAKNDGYIDFFNVDCTYKPFNPYIHITPNFHGLYGQDFDDIRGLVCGGDFSIAMMTDQWAQYEMQNKNYQQIFNTRIGTLDAFKDLAMNNLYIDTVNDVLNNNAAAAFNGAKSGGVPGAIVAGVQSTVNSGVKFAKGSYNINESNRIIKNQLTNNFMYQLGNIKALPYSLSKTSSFTRNNKIFPFIEVYSATDEEKDLLKQKLKYDGMTVMRIGKISDYLRATPSFIRGQIIRLEGIADDTHILNDIYNEIKQGVYL